MKIREKEFFWFFSVGLLYSLGMNISLNLFSMYAALSFSASNAVIGLITSVSALVSLLITLPSGVLSDKFGRKPMIVLGLTASLVGVTILFFASSISMLFLAQIVTGLSWPIFGPSMQALVADLAPPAYRGKAVGLYLLSPSIGMFMGPFVASLLLMFISIRDTFLYSLAIAAVSLVLVVLCIKPVAAQKEIPNFSLRDLGKILKNKSVIGASVISASFFFLNTSVLTFYPVYALHEFNTDPAMVAAAFSIRNLVLMIARIVAFTLLTSRIGEKKLIVGTLLVSASVAFIPSTQSYWQSSIFVILSGVAHGILFPIGAIIIANSTSSQERGTANSVYILFVNIASTLSPVLMGLISEEWGIPLIFPLIAVAPMVGILFLNYRARRDGW